ncbi:fibronectin type III domain-containing protein [Campylobacter concisus]|uniref:fibronectin type III domain-containing protein n=2 Tax=Campylobacter concisus TaxID=199 RepID=UPI00215661F4|nr:hypothetical protein [Campylobacter concisus]
MQQQRSYPKPVTNLQATKNAPKKIILTWDYMPAEDFSYYKVYRTTSKFLPYTYLAKTTSNTYEDLINTNAATRYYRVTAVDKDGLESLKQEEPIVGSTLGAPKTPNISAKYDGSGVNVSWSAVDRASSYTVYRSGASEKIFSGISENSLYDNSVQAGASYSYSVVAIDEYGIASDKSSKAEVSIK